jgi:hypothetical protein
VGSEQGSEILAQVLANVTDFRIRTDWSSDTGPNMDSGRLDNINLVPLPASVLLLGSGLVGLGLLGRRRKKS